jgi:hypothetical protein
LSACSLCMSVQLSLYDTRLEEDYVRRPTLVPLSNEWNACNLLIGEKEVSISVITNFHLSLNLYLEYVIVWLFTLSL